MKMITEPQWTAEVWGAATSAGTNKRDTANSNLVLYWGKGVRFKPSASLSVNVD